MFEISVIFPNGAAYSDKDGKGAKVMVDLLTLSIYKRGDDHVHRLHESVKVGVVEVSLDDHYF